jgi:hypothetical protein
MFPSQTTRHSTGKDILARTNIFSSRPENAYGPKYTRYGVTGMHAIEHVWGELFV